MGSLSTAQIAPGGAAPPDWLDKLAPAHAPPPASWWPMAPGWWMLLAAGLLLMIVVVWLIYRRGLRPQVLRRVALRELKQLEAQVDNDAALARELEHLLRRYAVSRYGREPVARLSGQRWIDFLVAHGGKAFDGAAGANLLRAAYGGSVNADRSQWLSGARSFIVARGSADR